FQYVKNNIPGPDRRIKEYYEQFEGCKCKDMQSCNSSCPCISRFGAAYDSNGLLTGVDPFSRKMVPILECNLRCQCKATCVNRVVQHGIRRKLEVFPTASKGFGLRAAEDIVQNSFVCEYAGELLTHEVARDRTRKLTNVDLNYIIAVHEGVGKDAEPRATYVDPTFIGNVGRFVNHSCSPNLYMVPVRVKNNIPHISLFALRDIRTGEELTYDYSGDIRRDKLILTNGHVKTDHVTSPPKVNEVTTQRKPCHCGSSNCCGWLPFDQTLYQD
ncbi:hypothetical protein CAPTEDRAFT_112305, partial [Capitella teleta]